MLFRTLGRDCCQVSGLIQAGANPETKAASTISVSIVRDTARWQVSCACGANHFIDLKFELTPEAVEIPERAKALPSTEKHAEARMSVAPHGTAEDRSGFTPFLNALNSGCTSMANELPGKENLEGYSWSLSSMSSPSGHLS